MNKKYIYNKLKFETKDIIKNQIITFFIVTITLILQTYLIIKMQVLLDLLVNKKTITQELVNFLLVLFIFSILTFLAQYSFRILTAIGKNKVIKSLYSNALKNNINFFKNNNSGELNSLIINDGEAIALWISTGWLTRFIQSICLLLNLYALVQYSLFLTLIILFCIFICFIFVNIIAKRAASISSDIFKIKGNITHFIIESFQLINSIKFLKKESYFGLKFNSIIDNQKYFLDRKSSILTALYMSLTIILMNILPLIAVGIGMFLVSNGNLSIGSIISIYALTSKLQEPVRIIAESLSQEKTAMRLIEKLSVIFPDETFNKKSIIINEFVSLNITINKFSYDNKIYLLNDINLAIGPKEIIVIKGKSGSGKSTLVNIIMGIITLQSGSLKINNIDIKNIPVESLWENILLKDQENLLIQGTIRENILFGDEFSDDEIIEIINVCCLNDFIEQYGLNKSLIQNGNNLSGGQKQRLTLARILIRKPNVLILDEPTSSLDKVTSKNLVSNIINFVQKYNITLIVISHENHFDCYSNNIVYIQNYSNDLSEK